MRRITAGLALALSLLGCGSPIPSGEPVIPSEEPTIPPGEPVELLTGAMPFDEDECTAGFPAFELILDPRFGTAVAGLPESGGDRYPVMWRPGFSGIRDGGRVVVVDPDGNFVATTGESYKLAGHILWRTPEPGGEDFNRRNVLSLIGIDMFYACGLVRPEPTMVPPGEQCGMSFACPTMAASASAGIGYHSPR
jgi:hypothetical protein